MSPPQGSIVNKIYLFRFVTLLGFFAILEGCSVGSYPPPPDTKIETVTDVLHGVKITDDYRWLEEQYALETREWIEAQNAYTEDIIGESGIRDEFRSRLSELIDTDEVGSTRQAGDWEYFTMRRKGEEAARIYRRAASTDPENSEPTTEDTYEIVLDPADLDSTYRTLVSIMDFSPDGNLMMYSVRQGGADEIAVRIRNLESGEDLPDRLGNALYSGVGFDDGGTGFYYTYRSRETGPRIRHHTLGQDSSEDEEIWGAGYGPRAFIGMDIVAEGKYRIFTVQHGWARNDIFIQIGDGPVRPIVEGVSAHFQHRFHDGRIYLRTDFNASNYRLLVVEPEMPERESWKELIPETDDLFESYSFIGDKIYATYLHDVANQIRVYDLDGSPSGEIDVPDNSSVSISASENGKASLSVSGYLTPLTRYLIDLNTGEREVADEPEVTFDSSAYELTKLWFTSTGGVRAPVYVMHRAGLELDGSHPTILNGYGGFNSNIKPGFSTTRLAWLEAGGVYAVATLRGGSEFGETWHQDGMLENKQHVFDDFISAAEKLIEVGFTDPDHLAISGGSNGGLLVGSAMTQRPELFRAVLCTYPDLDMVRFYQFTETNNMPALLEYGDASIASQFETMRRYSPYQAVRNGVNYPAVMLTTGDLDTRVSPLQGRKMTARLQAATASGLPVVLWYDSRGGHAGGRGRPISIRIEDTARELAFLAQQLGLGEEVD